MDFQYPLRAYGVWNNAIRNRQMSAAYFQYPLRAYGVWNRLSRVTELVTAGTFSTLCGPMGCGTGSPISLCRSVIAFQYPLRAYGVWNQTGDAG